MAIPVPTPVTQQVPISQFDCLRRSDAKTNLELDATRFETVGGIANAKTDAKMLWVGQAIPVRQIFMVGPQFAYLTAPDFFSAVASVQSGDPRFNRIQFGQFWFWDILSGTFVLAGTKLVPGDIGDTEHSLDPAHNGGHAASAWWFGAASGNQLATESYNLMAATVSQVICPNAFAPVTYELWTVTIRALAGNEVGPTVGNGMEFPWSLSTDFTKSGSGTLKPGETFIIPCPIGRQPQSPPAPPNKADPYNIQYWAGFGACTYMVFDPPLV